MKQLLLFAVALVSNISMSGQTHEWSHTFGASGFDRAMAVCRDGSGNIYTTGSFYGTVDFNPSPSVNSLTSTTGNTYVLKLSPAGEFIWVKSFHGSANQSTAIAVDGSGNVVVGGYFSGTVDFNPAAASFPLSNSPGIADDLFIARLDPQGNFVNAFKLGSVGPDGVDSIKVDGDGNIIISGRFFGTVDFDPGPAEYHLTSTGSTFIMKMDADMNLSWARTTNHSSIPLVIEIGSDGAIYGTGCFSGATNFNPGSETAILTAQYVDGFVIKFSPAGQYVWVRSFGGAAADYSQGIALDDTDNLYIISSHESDADYDPSASEYLLSGSGITALKLDSDGNFVWAKNITTGVATMANKYIATNSSQVYLVVSPQNSIDADPNEGVHNMIQPFNKSSLFVIGLDPQGNLNQTYQMDFDYGNFFQYNLGLDVNQDSLIISSDFKENGDLDVSSGAGTVLSSGQTDAFLISLQLPQLDVPQFIQPNLFAFPNPSSGSFSLFSNQPVDATLYDVTGRNVSSFKIREGLNQIQPQKPLSNGTYILKTTDVHGAGAIKILIEN